MQMDGLSQTFCTVLRHVSPRRCPCFDVVVGLVWSYDPKSYALVCATGKASHARQVKGDDPNKKGYPDPLGWGLGVRLTIPPRKKNIVTKPQEEAKAHPGQ
jgi:hypothetical protein